MNAEHPLHIVLHQPEIPQNTGNIGRTCVAIGARLWMIRPLGFRLDAKHLRRAGLDYWQYLDWDVVDSWSELQQRIGIWRPWYFSKKAATVYTAATYHQGDALVFGCETQGLPISLLEDNPDRCVRIPIRDRVRSLNLSSAVAAASYEAVRQLDVFGSGGSAKIGYALDLARVAFPLSFLGDRHKNKEVPALMGCRVLVKSRTGAGPVSATWMDFMTERLSIFLITVTVASASFAQAPDVRRAPRDNAYTAFDAMNESYQRADAGRRWAVGRQIALIQDQRRWNGLPPTVPMVRTGPDRVSFYAYGYNWDLPDCRPVFEPWPYVPGDIWGYRFDDPAPQPVDRRQIQTGPSRWESHPVYPERQKVQPRSSGPRAY